MIIWLTMTTTITKLWSCPQPKNWKIYQLRLRPEILDTCTIGLSVSKECIKVQNGFPYISRNEPTIGSQQYEYQTQLLALFFMNLDLESQQLGVPLPYKKTNSQQLVAIESILRPNSWYFTSNLLCCPSNISNCITILGIISQLLVAVGYLIILTKVVLHVPTIGT